MSPQVKTIEDTATEPSPSPTEPFEAGEREQLLEQIAHLQRLAQAGLVTAGLAHDVKNHITVLSGTAFLAERNPDPAEWKEALARIQEHCIAMTETTRAFLSFVERRSAVPDTTFRLSRVAENLVRVLGSYSRRRSVDLVTKVNEDASVRGDFQLALQAAVNVVSNAVLACEETGGRIELTLSRPLPGISRLKIADDGPGIPENLRPWIFRPFATGQGGGRGHGLGLFVTRQLVRQLDGSITVRTSPAGTSFFLDFPCAG